MNILYLFSISIIVSGSLCPVFAFGTPQACDAGSQPPPGPIPSSHIYITDTNGILPYNPLTYHTAILHDDDVWNISTQPRIVQVTLTIQNQDTGQQVFNQTQSLQMKACSGPEKVQWNFVPTQIAYYMATITDNKSKISMDFYSIHNSTANSPIIDLKVFPSEVRVGDMFNITAILVNNSQNPLIIDANPPCVNTVILDSHVTFDTKMATGCYDVFIKHTIYPGENFTMSYPDYGENFIATSTGTTNVTVPLSYYEDNQTVHSKTISKSIQFLIHDHTLQEQLDLARIQTEKHQQEEQQAKNISDAIILAGVGIPIAAGVSIGVLLFTRKRR